MGPIGRVCHQSPPSGTSPRSLVIDVGVEGGRLASRTTMRFARCLIRLLAVAFLTAPRGLQADDSDRSKPLSPRWALGFNPLAVAIGRYGFDVQRLLGPHNALLVNVHGDYASRDWPAIEYGRHCPRRELSHGGRVQSAPAAHGRGAAAMMRTLIRGAVEPARRRKRPKNPAISHFSNELTWAALALHPPLVPHGR